MAYMISTDAVIGERVHAAMWRARITQAAAARELGLDQAAVSRRLRGFTAWKVTELLTLSKLLAVDLAELLPEGAIAPRRTVSSRDRRRQARHARERSRAVRAGSGQTLGEAAIQLGQP